MLQFINLVGHLVSVREENSYVLVPAKVISQSDGKYTVEYAAGNTEAVNMRQVGVAPAWLIQKYHEMRNV